MSSIQRLVPRTIKRTLRKVFAKSQQPALEEKHCTVCKSKVHIRAFPYRAYFQKWFDHGFVFSPFLFETLNLKHYQCGNCGATDRERLMALYLDEYVQANSDRPMDLIDFAPVKALPQFLRGLKNVNYRSADLYMKHVDDVVDITDMSIYENGTFDIFICSHILEHIENDIDAMKELHRVTKEGGIGLCLVPIMLSLDRSLEDKSYLESEALRWKYFGQDDHVRMYSKNDFVSRLESVGFQVEQYGQDYFGSESFQNHGLDKKSVLYVVKK